MYLSSVSSDCLDGLDGGGLSVEADRIRTYAGKLPGRIFAGAEASEL